MKMLTEIQRTNPWIISDDKWESRKELSAEEQNKVESQPTNKQILGGGGGRDWWKIGGKLNFTVSAPLQVEIISAQVGAWVWIYSRMCVCVCVIYCAVDIN